MNRARGFFGRLIGPSLDQRTSQLNNNKISNFKSKKLPNSNAKNAFDAIPNKNTKLALVNFYKGGSNSISAGDIGYFLTHRTRIRVPTNYAQAGRKAAAAGGYLAQRGGLALAAPVAAAGGLTAATLGGLGYAGYQGGRAAAQGAQILGKATVLGAKAFAGAASNKYGKVRNTVSAKYNQFSGRNTNQRLQALSNKVNSLERRLNNIAPRIRIAPLN